MVGQKVRIFGANFLKGKAAGLAMKWCIYRMLSGVAIATFYHALMVQFSTEYLVNQSDRKLQLIEALVDAKEGFWTNVWCVQEAVESRKTNAMALLLRIPDMKDRKLQSTIVIGITMY